MSARQQIISILVLYNINPLQLVSSIAKASEEQKQGHVRLLIDSWINKQSHSDEIIIGKKSQIYCRFSLCIEEILVHFFYTTPQYPSKSLIYFVGCIIDTVASPRPQHNKPGEYFPCWIPFWGEIWDLIENAKTQAAKNLVHI
jgi:hypothetical protein